MEYTRNLGRTLLVLAAALLALTSTACGPPAQASESTARETLAYDAPREITIITKNYLFVAKDTIESGLTTIRLNNQGSELHHVQFMRLANGKTLDDLLAAMQQNPEGMPSFATPIGGPNAPQPGAQSFATIDLEPGNYALLCFIPTAKGVPHLAKGMTRALTVVPTRRPAARAPTADATIELDDYKFEVSAGLTAGTRTIKVENRAQQPHEVFVMRLKPGTTAEQALEGLMKGDASTAGEAMGGTTFIQSGGVNYITLDLVPGTYALYCFVPDAKDGKPHIAHGMMREITIS